MAKKLIKAQMGKIVKTAAKAVSKGMNAKVIPRGLPTTIGTLGGAGYVANEVYGKDKKSAPVPKKVIRAKSTSITGGGRNATYKSGGQTKSKK